MSVQPRIRLSRSFDERSHSYLGYVLYIDGEKDGAEEKFIVAVGKKTHEQYEFCSGMKLEGMAVPVPDRNKEIADLYKVSGLSISDRFGTRKSSEPPFINIPPDLEVFRERGHLRLDESVFFHTCWQCMWGCNMPVEIIVDHWNPHHKIYRNETFCYGPTDCRLYEAGDNRQVPGRKGMIYTEEDWVDEESLGYREEDD